MSNTSGNKIRLSGIIKESIVDGPGLRYVIFTQGCLKRCVGCHNEDTQPLIGGTIHFMDNLIEEFSKNPLLKGITISGGEPFLQAKEVLVLVNAALDKSLDVLLYSGYYYEELIAKHDAEVQEILKKATYLVDGPYEIETHSLNLNFRGSSNQRVIDLVKTNLLGTLYLHELNN